MPSEGALSEYAPFASVLARVLVPCTLMATPASGVPSVEVTLPETVIC